MNVQKRKLTVTSASREVFAVLAVVVCGLLGSTLTAAPPKLQVKSRTLLKVAATSPRENAVYVHPAGSEMMTGAARSTDNGQTWTASRPLPDFDSSLRKGFRRGTYPGFVDPVEDRLITLVLALDVPDLDPNIEEPPIGENEYYLRYRVSTDGGKTYLFDKRIQQEGDYSPQHPIDDVWLGKNGYYLGDVGCIPIRTREGKILVPVQVPLLGADGKLALPGGGFTHQYTRILIGTWTANHELRWEVSSKIVGDPDRTSRGLFEPTLIELPDGRVICIMRGSNGGQRDADCKWLAYKWISSSRDGGRTWSPAEPWKYSDGTEFYSPSAMSQLLKHSDGRIFWLGNLSATNCCGNNPRHPLVIGEVDSGTAGLIKQSVLTIDTLQPDDTEGINLSHWFAFEERPTGDIRIPMRRWTADYKKFQGVEFVVSVGQP